MSCSPKCDGCRERKNATDLVLLVCHLSPLILSNAASNCTSIHALIVATHNYLPFTLSNGHTPSCPLLLSYDINQ